MALELYDTLRELALSLIDCLQDTENIAPNSQCVCLAIHKKLTELFHEFEKKLSRSQASTSSGQTNDAPSQVNESQQSRLTRASIRADENAVAAKRKSATSQKSLPPEPKAKRGRRNSEHNVPDKKPNGNEASNSILAAIRTRSQRKTIDMRALPESDEESEEDTARKNTNRQMYSSNSLFRLCVYCNHNDRRSIVSHYTKQHPDLEVMIARPSPQMAKLIRGQRECFILRGNKLTGLCFLCGERKTMRQLYWASHILSHTGEDKFICTGCNTPLKTTQHNCSTKNIQKVFERNSSDGALYGYMCTVCNYLQASQDQLVKHLRKHHDFNWDMVNRSIGRVLLLPNVSHLKANIPYAFVEANRRLKCTICHAQFGDTEQFIAHFDTNHEKIDAYTCFCGKKLSVDETELSAHLLMHDADLYHCMYCESVRNPIYYTQKAIFDHMSGQHGLSMKFQHIHREPRGPMTITEIAAVNYICQYCDVAFQRIADAQGHFSVAHKGYMFDFKVSVVKKITEKANALVTKNVPSNDTEYILRQTFVCMDCAFRTLSEEKLLDHHREKHSSEALAMKLGEPVIARSDPAKEFHQLVFSCYWCHPSDEQFISGNVKSVHQHWLSVHSEQPFRFHVKLLIKCYYCDVIMTYTDLNQHTQNEHSGAQLCFVRLNDDKCPMCSDFSDLSGLPAHFSAAHKPILEINLIDPCPLPQDVLQKLMAIDIHKEVQCDQCLALFATAAKFNQHHLSEHPETESQSIGIFDNSCKIIIMACCTTAVEPQQFMRHLFQHCYKFNCAECQLTMRIVEKAAEHNLVTHGAEDTLESNMNILEQALWQTFNHSKLIFGNGVVLHKCQCNLLDTELGSADEFRSKFQAKKERYCRKFKAFHEGELRDSCAE